jgi:hypothetical protein
MKNFILGIAALFVSFQIEAQTIFINEIHYDNSGADTGEGVEIVGPAGTDLVGYKLLFYNGSNGNTVYDTKTLSGIIPNEQNNRGALWFARAGIQNGPDGIALVDNFGTVIQFLSYEAEIVAVGDEADGMTSTVIGVVEDSNTAIGESLQLVGEGSDYSDFTWVGPLQGSPGTLNANQTLSVVKNEIAGFELYPNPAANGKVFITSDNYNEKSVLILALNGQKVAQSAVKNTYGVIDISSLNKGVFIVKVIENGKISTRKLIIN